MFRTTMHATIRQHRVVDLLGKRRLTTMKVQVYSGKLGSYDFILGRDYLQRYGIDLCFSDTHIRWDGKSMPMHSPGY